MTTADFRRTYSQLVLVYDSKGLEATPVLPLFNALKCRWIALNICGFEAQSRSHKLQRWLCYVMQCNVNRSRGSHCRDSSSPPLGSSTVYIILALRLRWSRLTLTIRHEPLCFLRDLQWTI